MEKIYKYPNGIVIVIKAIEEDDLHIRKATEIFFKRIMKHQILKERTNNEHNHTTRDFAKEPILY